MITYLPRAVSNKAVIVYVTVLLVISMAFSQYAMGIGFIALGIIEVCSFFLLSSSLSKSWRNLDAGTFSKRVFFVALSIRCIWVVFSYFMYKNQTGIPFEWEAADSLGYHGEAEWLAGISWNRVWDYLFRNRQGVSDSGYVLYLTVVYKLLGTSVIVPRFIKAFLSAWMCVLVYKICSRTFNEPVGRLAAVFCMLMPNLIAYCGLHLKETEMLFLAVAFLERSDFLLRSKKYSFSTLAIPIVLAFSLFFFRTVLGLVALFSFLTAFMFTSVEIVGRKKKAMVIAWGLLAVLTIGGGRIYTESMEYWESRDENQDRKRTEQTSRGAQWARYATGTVMAPMVVVLPFSTMVDVDHQYNQQLLHGGNYVKNFLGLFVLIALFYALFVNKKWRDFSLIGAFTFGYLFIVAMSAFANSERFLLPAVPCLLAMAAYGVSLIDSKNIKLLNYWCVIVFVMEFAWAFFKLGSRGIL